MSTASEIVVALAIAIGLVGVLVPVLPGLLLVWAAVTVWAVVEGSTAGWVVFGLATVLFVAGTIVKYVVPGRRLRRAGVPWTSTAAGAAVGVVGFFVIPVVGLVLGFVLGIYLAELLRLGEGANAWRSTRQALAAAGWSMVIELATGLAIAIAWVVGVLI